MPKPTKQEIAVQYVPVERLKPAAYNPRTHDKAAEEKLKDSIRRFGMVDPIIANAAPRRKNVVIGGHFRLQMAKSLGIAEVPVVYVNIPDIGREKELNLRLNRNTGEWDWKMLQDFDPALLSEIGFDAHDLGNIWDDVLEASDDGFDADEAAKAIRKPTTRRGDLFRLGDHFLLCGNSTDPKDVVRLMGKAKADMVYSDPPYGIALDYSKGIGTKGKYGGSERDNRTPEEYRAFLKSCIANAKSAAKPNAHVFFWCDATYIGTVQSLYAELGVASRRVCAWIKNGFNVTPQVAFNKAYEPCVYGVRRITFPQRSGGKLFGDPEQGRRKRQPHDRGHHGPVRPMARQARERQGLHPPDAEAGDAPREAAQAMHEAGRCRARPLRRLGVDARGLRADEAAGVPVRD
jgi:hypothetical protein